MKFVKFILSLSIGLIVLICMEGILTYGGAFNFEAYTAFGYFVQALLLIITVCVSTLIWFDTVKKDEFKLNRL